MKQAWFMVTVDADVAHLAAFKQANCDTPHFAYVAWTLEQYAANPTAHKLLSGAGEFHAQPYGETDQVATFDFSGDECHFELHGRKLKAFNAVAAATVLRVNATSGLQQQIIVQGVVQAMQMMAQNQQEKPIVDQIMQGIRRN